MAVIVGRPINGIPLNGDEYLMEEGGTKAREFDSIAEAKIFLISVLGCDPIDVDEYFNYYEV